MIALTVFSFGAGQESTTLLYKIVRDPGFRAKHFPGRLLVVGSDTGDEHSHTYKNVQEARGFCERNGIEFNWITPDQGFHGRTWQSLTEQYKRNRTIGSAAYNQTCTDNLKVNVVDKFVEAWILKNYFPGEAWKNKKAIGKFFESFGGIRLVLGFAAGEEKRTSTGNKFDPVWKKNAVSRHFPLIEEGLDRQACIDYNEANVPFKVWPSNCLRCFYQSEIELLWLYRNEESKFWEWVDMERAKLQRCEGVEKNFGVYGKKTLVERLEGALVKYGNMSDEDLNEYKFSHGHCIKSKY